jgi:hypothetical protein
MLPEGTLAELIDNIIYRGSCTFIQPSNYKHGISYSYSFFFEKIIQASY